MRDFELNLQMFAEGGEPAGTPEAAAGAATAAEGQPEPVRSGDTLADGTKVPSTQVAAAMEKQMRNHPELRNVYRRGNANAQAQPSARPAAAQAAGEKTIEQRWEEAKKGEFAEMYGRDVKNAVQERFRNQQDAQERLNRYEPMMKVLRERAGVQTDDELIRQVLDDDSLYEEAANEAGMTIEAYKQFRQLKEEHEAQQQREQQNQRQVMLENHLRGLTQQAEEFRKSFPEFDLQTELRNNPTFLRLTGPDIRMSVEDAYFATHHRELAPQMMAFGMQKARQQLGQTIQAQGARPAEGAMRGQGSTAGEMKLDPTRMSRTERERIKQMVRMGRRITFD